MTDRHDLPPAAATGTPAADTAPADQGRRQALRHGLGVALAGRLLLPGAGAATLLAGCGGGQADAESARLRLVNASVGYATLDLRVDDSTANAGIAFGTAGSHAGVASGEVSTTLHAAGSATALSTASRSLDGGSSYSLVAYGNAGALKQLLITEDTSAAASGKAKLMVANLATDAGALDVFITGEADALDDAVAAASSVASGATVGHLTMTAGTWRLRVTGAGDKADLRLDVSGLVLASTQVATLVLTQGASGVLVHAMLVPQGGAVTALANSRARVRVVASVTGNGRVSLALGGTSVMAGGTSPSIGGYQLVAAGTPAAALTVNGVAVAMAAPTLVAGGDHTVLVWGDAAAPQVTLIGDDNRLPSSSTAARLRLVHGRSGLAGELSLVADYSTLASGIALGQASAFASVTASAAMLLEVTTPTQVAPLHSFTDVVIAAKGVYTVFVLGDAATPSTLLRKER